MGRDLVVRRCVEAQREGARLARVAAKHRELRSLRQHRRRIAPLHVVLVERDLVGGLQRRGDGCGGDEQYNGDAFHGQSSGWVTRDRREPKLTGDVSAVSARYQVSSPVEMAPSRTSSS